MIRTATEADVAAILEIYNDAIVNTTAVYAYTPHTLAQRLAWFRAHREAGYPVFVFEADHKAVGFAAFGSFREWPAYKYTVENSIYVHPDYRRRGIARQLMEQLITVAAEQQYATMVAGIDSQNEGSIRLHEQLGFKNVGTIQKAGFKFGRWLDLTFYQLMLSGPAHPVEAEEHDN